MNEEIEPFYLPLTTQEEKERYCTWFESAVSGSSIPIGKDDQGTVIYRKGTDEEVDEAWLLIYEQLTLMLKEAEIENG